MRDIVFPTLYCPFPSAINPHAEAVQAHTMQWAISHGLVGSERARQRLSLAKPGRLAARAHPNIAFDELTILADWITWGFMLDDQCDEAAMGKEPAQLAPVFASFVAILKEPRPAVARAAGPLGESLQELWLRMIDKALDPAWPARFTCDVEQCFEANIWQAENRAAHRISSVTDYIRMRPFAGGLIIVYDLIEIGEQLRLPAEVRRHTAVQALKSMCSNVVCWSNDIISLGKELAKGDPHNLVAVLKHERQTSWQEAVDEVARMHDAEVKLFLELEARLPSFGEEVDENVRRYVGAFRSWMRAHLDWSFESGRYPL